MKLAFSGAKPKPHQACDPPERIHACLLTIYLPPRATFSWGWGSLMHGLGRRDFVLLYGKVWTQISRGDFEVGVRVATVTLTAPLDKLAKGTYTAVRIPSQTLSYKIS